MTDTTEARAARVAGESLVERLLRTKKVGDGHNGIWDEPVNPDGPEAATTITALQAEVARLNGDKQRLLQHGLDTLEQWRTFGEARGILEGWMGLTDDPAHLALLRKNTADFLARAALGQQP